MQVFCPEEGFQFYKNSQGQKQDGIFIIIIISLLLNVSPVQGLNFRVGFKNLEISRKSIARAEDTHLEKIFTVMKQNSQFLKNYPILE